MTLDKIWTRTGAVLAIVSPIFRRVTISGLVALIAVIDAVVAVTRGRNRIIVSKILMGIGNVFLVIALVLMTRWSLDPAIFAVELILKVIVAGAGFGMVSLGKRMRDRR